MVTFRSSVKKRFVEALEENVVDIIRNVHEAVYLSTNQQRLYIQGRIASAIRQAVPEGEITPDLHVYPSVCEMGVMTYEMYVTLKTDDFAFVHGVRVKVDANYLAPGDRGAVTKYSIVERSSQTEVDFERTVHRLASDAYDDILRDTTMSSQECIISWEARVTNGLRRVYNRSTFDAELTMHHGVHGVNFEGVVTDEENDTVVTVSVDMDIPTEVVAPSQLPTEVIIDMEDECLHERKVLQCKMSSVSTAALVESFLKFESALPSEEALTGMTDYIQKELTQQLDNLNFQVSVGFYNPQNAVSVAIVELDSSVGISLIAKRK